MTTIADVLTDARSEVGYVECPRDQQGRCLFTGHSGPGRNHTKFAREAGHANGTYWCATGTSAILIRAGVRVPKGALTASTRANKAAWQAARRWIEPAAVEPGDVLFFHLTGRNGTNPNVPDHTGFATARPVKTRQPSIEFNTSSDDAGSQDDGGGVYEKLRSTRVVIGAGRPWYSDYDQPLPPAEPTTPLEDDVFIANPVTDTDPGQYFVNGDTYVPLATIDELNQLRNSGFVVRDMEPLAWKLFKETATEVAHP